MEWSIELENERIDPTRTNNYWHQPKRKHRHHRYHNLNQTIDTSQNNRFKTDSKSIRNLFEIRFEIRFENIHTRNCQLESNHRYHRTINSRCDTEVENLQNQNEVCLLFYDRYQPKQSIRNRFENIDTIDN